MRISDWSSDVCSSDLARDAAAIAKAKRAVPKQCGSGEQLLGRRRAAQKGEMARHLEFDIGRRRDCAAIRHPNTPWMYRSEEHTSELQSLMRISYAVFCLQKKKNTTHTQIHN